MKKSNYIVTILLATFVFASFAFAEKTQIVNLTNTDKNITVGQKFTVTANYDTQSDEGSFGLGVRIHFDSNKVKFIGFKDSFIIGKTLEDTVAKDDTRSDFDQSTVTDKYVVIGWSATADFWPNMPTPVKLSDLLFEAIAPGGTQINVSFSSISSGYQSQANNVLIDIQ
jgi:hypothetical protein